MTSHVTRDAVQVHKSLFIAIESLRQGYDLVLKTLPGFITNFLEPVPPDSCQSDQLLDFYLSMGVHQAVARQLAEMQIAWSQSQGKLNVSAEALDREGEGVVDTMVT